MDLVDVVDLVDVHEVHYVHYVHKVHPSTKAPRQTYGFSIANAFILDSSVDGLT